MGDGFDSGVQLGETGASVEAVNESRHAGVLELACVVCCKSVWEPQAQGCVGVLAMVSWCPSCVETDIIGGSVSRQETQLGAKSILACRKENFIVLDEMGPVPAPLKPNITTGISGLANREQQSFDGPTGQDMMLASCRG